MAGGREDEFEVHGGWPQILASSGLARERTVICLGGHEHRPLDMTVNSIRVLRAPVGYLRGRPCDDAEKAEEILGVFVL